MSFTESGGSPAREHNGLNDLLIARAPAQVPGDGFSDFSLTCSWIAIQEALGREDHAGSAIPALDRSFFHKGCLEGMEPLRGLDPFDCRHLFPIRLNSEHEAGVDRLSVQEHGAGAAISNKTSGLGAGEVKLFADHLKKRLVRLDCEYEGFVVDGNLNGLFHWHPNPPNPPLQRGANGISPLRERATCPLPLLEGGREGFSPVFIQTPLPFQEPPEVFFL
jgi:hypothetical protein